MKDQTLTGIERIAAERQRQITKEGWTPEHDDDEHMGGDLARVAAVYALPPNIRDFNPSHPDITIFSLIAPSWDEGWFKPTPDNRIRELEKAGALCAAEIDRLLRGQTKAAV